MASKRFEADLRGRLRDPDFALAYICAALDDDDAQGGVDGLLHVVRELALSREGGLSGVAHAAKVGRQTVYDGFRPGGNPQIRTVDALLRSVGYKLNVCFATPRPGREPDAVKPAAGER